MIKWGVCCLFAASGAPRFGSATMAQLARFALDQRRRKLSTLAADNASVLLALLEQSRAYGFGGFRVGSAIIPRMTHPALGFSFDELPDAALIRDRFGQAKSFGLRLSLHPDQFVTLSSASETVWRNSRRELLWQNELAEMLGCTEINLHGGGAQGGKEAALERFAARFSELPDSLRRRITLENDDRIFTPDDLLNLTEELEIPLVLDVHHWRCNPGKMSLEEATCRAEASWHFRGETAHFHLSTPDAPGSRKHAEYIDPRDFPDCWRKWDLLIDVEAKAKELAVLRLMRNKCAGISNFTRDA
ncbi:MAG: UV DNA damage repair endonuclease UvsE [Victivallaceae bacterium]|nr:UV DNA damage repair endonuclease UvsE [Victivallaceae bacterium]